MQPTPHEIEQLERAALLPLWRSVMQSPPPKQLSTPFLRRFIAFELQAKHKGGLPTRFDKQLSATRDTINRARQTTPDLQPGARLLREWNGATHVVDVTDDGFQWKDERHISLSSIAAPSPVPIGPARGSSDWTARGKHELAKNPVRHLHPKVLRRKAGSDLQVTRCATRSMRGIYCQPTP